MGPDLWGAGSWIVKTCAWECGCFAFSHSSFAAALSWTGPCLLGWPNCLAMFALLLWALHDFIFYAGSVRAHVGFGLSTREGPWSLIMSLMHQPDFTSHLPLLLRRSSVLGAWWKGGAISLITLKPLTQHPNEGIHSCGFPSQYQNGSGIWACANKLSYLVMEWRLML